MSTMNKLSVADDSYAVCEMLDNMQQIKNAGFIIDLFVYFSSHLLGFFISVDLESSSAFKKQFEYSVLFYQFSYNQLQ